MYVHLQYFPEYCNNASNSYSEESLREIFTGDCGNVLKDRMKWAF